VSDRPAKPVPAATREMAPFWEAAKRHQLVVQRCEDCGALRFPAREVCSRCLSRRVGWQPVSGRGTVFSVAVMHQANHPAFAAEVPYAVVVVQLDEGVRLVSNVVDVPAREVAIGLPVEVVFDDVTPEITLPRFRRRAA
jgi:uncharacterized OB-fold protein